MVAALAEGPATVQDIAEETGLTDMSVRGYIRAMRKRRVIHIARWEHDAAGRQTLAAYQLGQKRDAVRVPPRSRAEMARHYRARKRDARILGVSA